MHSYQALRWANTVLLLLVILSCTLPWYSQSVETKETTASGGNTTGTSLVLYQMFYRYGSNDCPDASLCTAQTWLLDGPSDGVTLWTYDSSLRDTRIVFAAAWLTEMVALLFVPLVYFRMINLSFAAALALFIASGIAVFIFLLLPAALLRDLGSDCLYSQLPGNFSSPDRSACDDFVGSQEYMYTSATTGEVQQLQLQWGPSIGWYASVGTIGMAVLVLGITLYRLVRHIQNNSPDALKRQERVENSRRWLIEDLSANDSSSYGSFSESEFSDEEVVKKTKSRQENWPATESSSESFPKVILSARAGQLVGEKPTDRPRQESDAWLESDDEHLLLGDDSVLEPLSSEYAVDDTSDVEVQIATL